MRDTATRPRAERDSAQLSEAKASGPYIQSLQRGFRILEVVTRSDKGVAVAEIARETGLHVSTAFHLLRTLVALGYVSQDDGTRRYRLGPKVFQLGAAAWSENHLAEIAAPLLAAMARRTGETSHLAVRHRDEIITISKIDGSSPVQLAERVGSPRPAHCTAIGKILLAWLPDAERKAFLAQARLEPRTPKTITSVAQLERELVKVRAQGYAFDDEEFTQGIRCIAGPVRNFSGRVAAALGISAPVWRVSLDRVAELTSVVMTTGTALSEQLGYPSAPSVPSSPARGLPEVDRMEPGDRGTRARSRQAARRKTRQR
jgi:DNA-binding IclR family transcriptional regulator